MFKTPLIDIYTEKRRRDKFATGGLTRMGFGEGTKTKLVQFIEKFKLKNNRAPTIMEVADGAKSSTASIKKYLKEGTDFTVASKLEAAKLGGKKSGAKRSIGTTKVISPEIYDEFKNLQVKGLSTGIDVSKTGSIEFRLRFDKKLKLKDLNLPATPENLEKIKLKINEVVNSKKYKDNIKPFQTPEDQRKIKREKYAQYKEQDPFRVYEQLQDYKTKKFPGAMSKEVQIQHGQPKFTTQTLSRFGLIPADVNVDPNVEKIEGIRNELVKNTRTKLNNPSRSLTDKKNIVEQFNNVMKGLRGQLKGTKGQGLVNFELFDIDEKGNITKLKDTGFDPKKGMAYKNKLGELDLSKITKAEADEIVNLGKRYIDRDFIKRTVDVTTADKIKRPEKAELMDMYRDAFKEKGFISTDLLKDVGKGAGKLLTAAGTPLGVVGLTAGFGIDPTSAVDRATLGVEAALAPSLVKATNQLTKNALIRKLFNLGLSPQAALRAARIASPLGIASLGGEALYQYNKFVKNELERIKNMTPEEREAYNVEQEEQMGIAAANGGLITRQAFKDGFDPKKRRTVKILSGLATIPIAGKYLKILGPLVPAVTETIQRSGDAVPTFLYDLINKVKAKGMKFFTGNRADEFEYVYERDGYQVREQGNKITVRKRIDDGEMLDKDMEMELEVDPETGGITYKEATARPDADGKLKDVEEYIEDVDLEEMRKYTYDE